MHEFDMFLQKNALALPIFVKFKTMIYYMHVCRLKYKLKLAGLDEQEKQMNILILFMCNTTSPFDFILKLT